MENMPNISSEEELLQLRNEGKVSEAQYQDLLEAMRRTSVDGDEKLASGIEKTKSKRKLGKTALVLMFLGIIAPIVLYMTAGLALWPKLFLCLILEIAAFVMGIISWPNEYGKATVITISAVAVLISLNWLMSKKEHSLRTTKMDVQTARQRDVQERTLKQGSAVTELEAFALDDLQGLITQSGVSIDKVISSDGNGSLQIDATEPTTIHLFETGDIDIENARLIYQAKVCSRNVQGQVYLEMWCHFPGKGEFFSKGLMNPLTGTTDWTTMETPFLLKEGENPDNVKLNLVITGKGKVWIDDIRLLKGTLP